MAYCVHCGVRLGDAEPRCPLCGTEVIDPALPRNPEASKPFPVRTPEQTLILNRRYALSLLSALLLLPAALCLLLDLLGGQISWSIYPAGVLLLCWIAVSLPLLMKRHRLYRTILITGATLAGYLFMVEQLSEAPGWFLPIVFPALALLMGAICLTIALIRKWKRSVLQVVAAALIQAGLLSLAVELLCAWQGIGAALTWSQFVMAPCFFVALLIILISKNRPLFEELKRRLHF